MTCVDGGKDERRFAPGVRRTPVWSRWFVLTVLLLITGCDTSFSVFQESDRYFSVFGYLDARRDTQWVRVNPIRDSVLVGSSPFDASVFSRNLQTGERAVWRDSVFTFDVVGVEGIVSVHNFWTTADIEPGITYRFTVEREHDGATSTAEVTVPDGFPPLVIGGELPRSKVLFAEVRGVNQIGAVELNIKFSVRNRGVCLTNIRTFYYLADTTRLSSGHYQIPIHWYEDIQPFFGEGIFCGIYYFRLSVASGDSPDWPSHATPVSLRDTVRLPFPWDASNIENGTGILGGTVVRSRLVPSPPVTCPVCPLPL